MAEKRKGDYDIGYGKPPQHTRFKPGQSGNPKGRPAGVKNLKTDLLEELGERVEIREGDRNIRVTKQRLLLKTQLSRAVKGSDRAAAKILDLYLRVFGIGDDADEAGLPLDDDERAVMQGIKDRLLRKVHLGDRENSATVGQEEDGGRESS